jgi:WD40 repeat protein
VAIGRVELDRDPTTALAFARASLQQADTREARLLAAEALWRAPVARVLQLGPEMSGLGRLAFAPDASSLAGAGFGTTVVLLRRDGGAPLLLGGHPALADPRDVLFSPRGDRLLTWGVRDPFLRLWSLAGRPAGTLAGPAQLLAFRSADELVAWGPAPGHPERRQLRSIRLSSGSERVLATWSPGWDIGTDHAGMRAPTSVDPSATWLAYARGGEVRLHRLADADSRRDAVVGRHASKVLDVSFDPSGRHLLSADQAGELRLWEAGTWTLLRSLRGAPIHERGHVAFDRDGSRIAWASGTDRAVHVWDLRAPPAASLLTLRRSGNVDPGDPAFAPVGSWLASSDLGGHVAFWPTRQPYSRVIAVHTDGPLFDLAFSPDSSLLASCGRDGLRLTPIAPSAPPLSHLDLGADYFCYGLAWDGEGGRLAVVAPQQGVFVVDRLGAHPRRVLVQPSQTVALSGVAFDPSGTRLVVGSHYGATPGEVRLYAVDIRTGTSRSWPVGLPGSAGRPFADGARDVRFSHDGRLLSAGGGGVRRWDLATGASERLAGGPGSMAALDTSRDGRRLVAVLGGGRIGAQPLDQPVVLAIDLVTGEQRTIANHGSGLTRTIATDAAGERVVTGDGSGIVRVGSTAGGEPQLLLGHQGAVERLAVSPDGRWIASSSGAEIRLWPALPYQELVAGLDSLTNVRVVEDPASPNGYRVELAPFPGWRDAPTW